MQFWKIRYIKSPKVIWGSYVENLLDDVKLACLINTFVNPTKLRWQKRKKISLNKNVVNDQHDSKLLNMQIVRYFNNFNFLALALKLWEKKFNIFCRQGMQSTEVAILLLTQETWVWLSAIPKNDFDDAEIYWQRLL